MKRSVITKLLLVLGLLGSLTEVKAQRDLIIETQIYTSLNLFIVNHIVGFSSISWQNTRTGQWGSMSPIVYQPPFSGTPYWVKIFLASTGFSNGDIYRFYFKPDLSVRQQFARDGYSAYMNITQWGDAVWDNLDYSFANTDALQITATDVPNLSSCTSMKGTFVNSSVDAFFGNWNVSNVSVMTGMFQNSGMSTTNMDKTLSCWSKQSVKSGTDFSASGKTYCRSQTAINTLTAKGWAVRLLTQACDWESGVPSGKIAFRNNRIEGYTGNSGWIKLAGNYLAGSSVSGYARLGFDGSPYTTLEYNGQKYSIYSPISCDSYTLGSIPGVTPPSSGSKIAYYSGEFYYWNGSQWVMVKGYD